MKDSTAALQGIVGEADALIRRRLENINLAVPHIVMSVTPEGEVVLHANVAPEVLRAFADDLKSVADEMAAPPEPGRHDALAQFRCRSGADVGGR